MQFSISIYLNTSLPSASPKRAVYNLLASSQSLALRRRCSRTELPCFAWLGSWCSTPFVLIEPSSFADASFRKGTISPNHLDYQTFHRTVNPLDHQIIRPLLDCLTAPSPGILLVDKLGQRRCTSLLLFEFARLYGYSSSASIQR